VILTTNADSRHALAEAVPVTSELAPTAHKWVETQTTIANLRNARRPLCVMQKSRNAGMGRL